MLCPKKLILIRCAARSIEKSLGAYGRLAREPLISSVRTNRVPDVTSVYDVACIVFPTLFPFISRPNR